MRVYSVSHRGQVGSGSMRELVTGYESGNREERITAYRSLSPFYTVQDPDHEMMTPSIFKIRLCISIIPG